jgi:hypothetical protein
MRKPPHGFTVSRLREGGIKTTIDKSQATLRSYKRIIKTNLK